VTRAWIESIPPSQWLLPIASTSQHTSPLTPPPGPAGLPPQYAQYALDSPPTLFYGSNREPLIIGPEEGGFESLGGKLPSKDLTVGEIARLVGPDRMVDVIGGRDAFGYILSSLYSRRRHPTIRSVDIIEMG